MSALHPCPRAGCGNTLNTGDMVVCVVDFHALASTCRGKKPLGEPVAAMIQGTTGGYAYTCVLCRQWHNGKPMQDRAAFTAVVAGTVDALRNDPRVGPAGLLRLADAWRPNVCRRARWWEDLDQTVLFA